MQISAGLTTSKPSGRASSSPPAAPQTPADGVSLGQQHSVGCPCCTEIPAPKGVARPAAAAPSPRALAASGGAAGLEALQGAPGTAPVQAALSLSEKLARLKLNPEEVTHVLYHQNCFDGMGAAFAAWKLLGDKAEYIAVSDHGKPPDLPPDAKVAIVDFSYHRPVLEEMKGKVADLVVLDHHKSAQEALAGLPYAVFEMDRAGAGLSWEFFHKGHPEPELLQYVEDRDIWTNKLPMTQEVNTALSVYPKDFEVWDGLSVDHLKAEGVPILRYKTQLIESACKRARMASFEGHNVPVLNVPAELRSDIGDALCNRHPESPFCALYYVDQDNVTNWSLRSRGEFDVAKLAEKYGGGGHKNAAAFRIEPGQPAPV